MNPEDDYSGYFEEKATMEAEHRYELIMALTNGAPQADDYIERFVDKHIEMERLLLKIAKHPVITQCEHPTEESPVNIHQDKSPDAAIEHLQHLFSIHGWNVHQNTVEIAHSSKNDFGSGKFIVKGNSLNLVVGEDKLKVRANYDDTIFFERVSIKSLIARYEYPGKLKEAVVNNSAVTNLSFDWKKVGENAGADKLEVNACGHVGEVYKAVDNMQWTARVDMVGSRPFESEAAAKQFVEKEIQTKLVERFNKATSDLALLTELKLGFPLAEQQLFWIEGT